MCDRGNRVSNSIDSGFRQRGTTRGTTPKKQKKKKKKERGKERKPKGKRGGGGGERDKEAHAAYTQRIRGNEARTRGVTPCTQRPPVTNPPRHHRNWRTLMTWPRHVRPSPPPPAPLRTLAAEESLSGEAEEGGCETDDGMEAGWSARWYPQNSGPSLWPGALYLLMSRIITYTYTLSLALTLTLSLSILPLSLPSVSLAPCTCSCLE